MTRCYGRIRGEFNTSDCLVRAVDDSHEKCEVVLVDARDRVTLGLTFSIAETKALIPALRRFLREANKGARTQ